MEASIDDDELRAFVCQTCKKSAPPDALTVCVDECFCADGLKSILELTSDEIESKILCFLCCHQINLFPADHSGITISRLMSKLLGKKLEATCLTQIREFAENYYHSNAKKSESLQKKFKELVDDVSSSDNLTDHLERRVRFKEAYSAFKEFRNQLESATRALNNEFKTFLTDAFWDTNRAYAAREWAKKGEVLESIPKYPNFEWWSENGSKLIYKFTYPCSICKRNEFTADQVVVCPLHFFKQIGVFISVFQEKLTAKYTSRFLRSLVCSKCFFDAHRQCEEENDPHLSVSLTKIFAPMYGILDEELDEDLPSLENLLPKELDDLRVDLNRKASVCASEIRSSSSMDSYAERRIAYKLFHRRVFLTNPYDYRKLMEKHEKELEDAVKFKLISIETIKEP